MTLQLGGKPVTAMYVGDRPVERAYLGTELVWSAEPPTFDPFALGWAAAGWAEDPDWSIADGDPVASWPGHGATMSMDIGTYKPIWTADGIGGRPVVRFDGANDRMVSDTALMTQPTSIVIVARYRSIPSGVTSYLCDGDGSTGGSSLRQIIASRPSGKWGAFAGAFFDSTFDADTAPHVFAATYAGASSRLIVDTDSVTGNAGNYSLANFQLAGNGAPVDIAFWGVYPGDITTDPDWPAWQAWAFDHYGIAA